MNAPAHVQYMYTTRGIQHVGLGCAQLSVCSDANACVTKRHRFFGNGVCVAKIAARSSIERQESGPVVLLQNAYFQWAHRSANVYRRGTTHTQTQSDARRVLMMAHIWLTRHSLHRWVRGMIAHNGWRREKKHTRQILSIYYPRMINRNYDHAQLNGVMLIRRGFLWTN